MPFPMKIQPIDPKLFRESARNESVKPVSKSRLKRLFDRQFPSVLRNSSAVSEKQNGGAVEAPLGKDGALEFEPSSVCLDKMVQNFIEESNEKPSVAKYGRNRCNCFNGNSNDNSDDEFDFGFGDSNTNGSFVDSSDTLESLIPCVSISERNLLADTSNIVEKNRNCKRKMDLRKSITESLLALGYDASVCRSRWDKSPSYPAGEYEYMDVIVEGERVLIDVDFKSEFEIARSTSNYKTILQSLPYIFVGKADRLHQIVSIVSEAAKQSLNKKGMHVPPWRKVEYMKNKWLSQHIRTTPPPRTPPTQNDDAGAPESLVAEEIDADKECFPVDSNGDCGELDLLFGEKINSSSETNHDSGRPVSPPGKDPGEEVEARTMASTWLLPAIKPKSKVLVTGLASLLKEKTSSEKKSFG